MKAVEQAGKVPQREQEGGPSRGKEKESEQVMVVVHQPDVSGVATTEDGVKIAYDVYKSCEASMQGGLVPEHRQKVLMIMGIATTRHGWMPQIEDLLLPSMRLSGAAIDICVFDNRGIGKSSAPSSPESYSIEIMANDAMAVVGALGWEQFHLIGFSMGGMISMKLASLYYDRLLSLSLLGVTEGGWQVLPRSWKALKYAIRMWMAKSAEERSIMDIKYHYSKKTLKEKVSVVGGSSRLRKHCLYEEYLEQKASCEGQTQEALNGQMIACWNNQMEDNDYERIHAANIPIVVLHGRQDLVAAPCYGRRIARKLGAKFVEIEGAHLITRECAHDVSHELLRIVSDCATEAERKKHLNRTINGTTEFLSTWDSAKRSETEEELSEASNPLLDDTYDMAQAV